LTSYAYGDPVGGWNAGAAALIALFAQARTGAGRHINLSQVECMLPMAAPFIVEQSVCGQTSARTGNDHPVFAPHGIYRCAGDDDWLVVSVANDRQWKALTKVMQVHHLEADASLNHVAGRRAQKQQIDSQITRWTQQRSADSAMRELQQAGISAGVVRPIWTVIEDPHFQERGVFRNTPRAYLGEYLATTPWYRETASPTKIVRPAPTLGEHSAEVFSRVLGMTQQQLRELEISGISGTTATKKAA
jgi:crotonobetainyl-CoA:carnitine CoA-transferase CaiB-like acyl-CoA transferase